MGYFKCTILFNICTISFLSYYDIGCTMFTQNVYGFADFAIGNFKIGVTKLMFLDSGFPRGRRGGFVYA